MRLAFMSRCLGRIATFVRSPFTPVPDEESLPLRGARIDALLMTEQMRATIKEFLGAACAVGSMLIWQPAAEKQDWLG